MHLYILVPLSFSVLQHSFHACVRCNGQSIFNKILLFDLDYVSNFLSVWFKLKVSAIVVLLSHSFCMRECFVNIFIKTFETDPTHCHLLNTTLNSVYKCVYVSMCTLWCCVRTVEPHVYACCCLCATGEWNQCYNFHIAYLLLVSVFALTSN